MQRSSNDDMASHKEPTASTSGPARKIRAVAPPPRRRSELFCSQNFESSVGWAEHESPVRGVGGRPLTIQKSDNQLMHNSPRIMKKFQSSPIIIPANIHTKKDPEKDRAALQARLLEFRKDMEDSIVNEDDDWVTDELFVAVPQDATKEVAATVNQQSSQVANDDDSDDDDMFSDFPLEELCRQETARKAATQQKPIEPAAVSSDDDDFFSSIPLEALNEESKRSRASQIAIVTNPATGSSQVVAKPKAPLSSRPATSTIGESMEHRVTKLLI